MVLGKPKRAKDKDLFYQLHDGSRLLELVNRITAHGEKKKKKEALKQSMLALSMSRLSIPAFEEDDDEQEMEPGVRRQGTLQDVHAELLRAATMASAFKLELSSIQHLTKRTTTAFNVQEFLKVP